MWSRPSVVSKTFRPVIASSVFSVGAPLARSWRLLDQSWPTLGASWGYLGRSWAPLGCSWAPLGHILAVMDASGLDFDPPGLEFGSLRGSILDSSMPASTCGMNRCTRPILAFTWAFRFPHAARRYVRSTWNWSQVRHFGTKKSLCQPFLAFLS